MATSAWNSCGTALADEISNTLTYTRTLDVRPSAMTRKFVGNDVDPQAAGQEMHVANVITGHFLKQGDRLLITLEAIQVEGNKLLWQTNVTAPAQDLIALQAQICGPIRQGLLPALGATGGYLDTGTRPKNPEAYDLYLHSLALPHDAAPNKDAIAVLEHVVEVDPTYAPAWEQLGLRCYYDADYSDGGEPMFQRSIKACSKAVELDPNRLVAAGQLVSNSVERGELGKAYQAAQALVKRRPDSAQTHMTMAMCIAMPECWNSQRTNATRRCRLTRVTTRSVRAHGRLWRLGTRSARRTLFVWTRGRSGRHMRRHRCCCVKARLRRRGKR